MNDDITSAKSKQDLKFPPGPDINNALNFWESPLKSFTELIHQYGDIVSLDPNTHKVYLVNHPDNIKHVLQDNYRNYTKDSDSFKPVLGNGLFVSEGDFWLRQRRMMQPAFHRQNLEEMIPAIVKTTTELLTRWQTIAEQGESIDIFQEMTKLMMNISATTMFGVDIADDIQSLADALKTAQEYVYYQGWDYLEQLDTQDAEKNEFQKAIETIDQIVYRIIREGRQNPQNNTNLLSILLAASDEATGNKMSEEQLRDEIVGLLAGGQSTNAIALTWIFYTLAMHPDAEQRIYTELTEVLGQRSPTFQDLSNLSYTRQVIDEVLRLYPPSWLTARRSIKSDEIAGYHIPENAEVFICPYIVHRHPSFWENPEQFNPERFAPGHFTNRSHFAYLAFSGGPHICIGSNFSTMALQTILALIMKTYRLSLTSNAIIEPQPQILLQPETDISMKLEKR